MKPPDRPQSTAIRPVRTFKSDDGAIAGMLAIAGSKGGCGKTTTTLGVAGAFARAETPALAIDADRQMPDLHVTAGVDREPTLASLEDADAGAIAQPVSGLPGVSVLPGPKPAESVNVQRALEHLDSGDSQVLVDCPSGTGPDLTDPLAAADAVVVVTTDSGQSIADAETTVEVADRLGVPVAGAIVTMADDRDAAEARLDVPVLATVPESESPLADEAVHAAYDSAVERLRTVETDDPDPIDPAGTRMATGVESIDRQLGGGLPPGSIAAVVGEPDGHAESLLHRLTTARGTLYLSTDRPARLVRTAMSADGGPTGSPAMRTVGADPLEDATGLLADLPDGANFVVDPADVLEAHDRDAYLEFLRTLKDRMLETDGIAVLHCLEGEQRPANRGVTERVADAVLAVSAVRDGTALEARATVRKFRPDPSARGTVAVDAGERS
ncbi:RecA-superfamily ATPase implicated in signal transduction, inactivated [Halapricum desulfuricans]|uniref:RecA-superfamily ATPase implicated in signal transduction, inactivated n=2 Tax=Halapricum desulfuricans TaxID=2841257 RepID=A0A897N2X9_9EURY|nr:RecA-superfamily ATPase implicated in signal transduction, inactivated [Halapricum desulfuricans]